ncbi:P-loop NTPase fold protein [Priestia megaterium]|uniref:P-loop NTPase fold protein n=1 Tax=Priestia megaterium TaxID=1404 RepID=UPI00367138B4
MSRWNNELGNFINKVAEKIKYLNNLGFDYFHRIIKDYNSIMILCLITILLGLYFGNKAKKSKETPFTASKSINIISHITLACIFGYLLNTSNVVKLNQLLAMYWSIGFFLYSFFFIIFIKELFIYLKSLKKITKNFIKVYYILGLTYIFAAISSNQLVIINDLLIILLFILGWMVLQIMSQEIKNENNGLVDEESDVEVKSLHQLLPTRKKEYIRVLEVLRNNNYDEPFALVLNGDWGVGKTSLINVLSRKLLEDGNFKIFIQPMILDTTEKLLDYFFKQLEDILTSNGIYTGKDSPFKRYINILFQTINTVNLKQVIKLDGLLDSLDDDEQVDFRTSKERLEKDIEKLLIGMKRKNEENNLDSLRSKKKIYIIIDDFDRVEEETFNNTLIFIKELVNFKGINVIFLMDEQKIDAHEKIDRTYLDKFINRKLHLSKINYPEIFNHFIKSIREEYLEDEWTKEVGNKIKENIASYIEGVTNDFEKRAEETQRNIEDLLKNKTSKIQNENGDSSTELHTVLSSEKEELEKSLQRLNNGITNVRKAKKIIREIKEILIVCDQLCVKNEYFKVNLNKIERIEELVIRIAIFKIIFGEYLDKLMQQNDFSTTMSDIKYLKHRDELLSSFFIKFINMGITEEQGLKMDVTNDFCNALILGHSFNKLFEDKKTLSENILDKLDDHTINLNIKSMDEIREYLKVIMFNTYGTNINLVNARRSRLINYIITLYQEGHLTLRNLFEILGKPQRNPLLDNDLYLSKLNEITSIDGEFQDEQDKTVSFTYLKEAEKQIFLNYRTDILMSISLLKLSDYSYRYEDITADLGHIYNLEDMIKAIKPIFTLEDTNISDLNLFKQWFNNSLNDIIREKEDNLYVLNAVKQLTKKINNFIEVSQLKEALVAKLKDTSVDPINRFNEKPSINSPEELVLFINEFHEYIYNNNGSITPRFDKNFSYLLTVLEGYTRGIKFEDETINKVEELYNSLSLGQYNEDPDTKRTYLWWTVLLGEIKENIKQLRIRLEAME